mmetsp:Transcript_21295/g.52472  ORF Transcript_21295/g.52472 Transcript_21295/m.52472 type:complete len:897 (+) Transcript_21295:88-2778(+)|eukprot:CAMPEP_0113641958 /NCGR_PEP_ID=MMETSP0017_2-20120614/22041_1 /TAXON_ID=2856 /ORGANISM="Cylindrotheca closterium" /LENGTH=896 /DNA_ID=CAMNT_0000553355 /DNA_START=61 /DNA_END=2751 /DNA_ORIENTATION=- /assembly_acc=CAM_ASM_000147
MKGKRNSSSKTPQNNSCNNGGKRTRRGKRSRPVWAIEVSNMTLSTKVMQDLQRYFIKRVCPWRDKLVGMGFTDSGQSFYFEFQNESQQKVALGFNGEEVGRIPMRIRPWNQESVPLKQESGPPDSGGSDSDSVQSAKSSSESALSLNSAQDKHDDLGGEKSLGSSSSQSKSLSLDNAHSLMEIESKDRLLSAANEHIKVLTTANSKYEKRIADQFSKIEEFQAKLKNYQLQAKEQSLKKDQQGRNEGPNDTSESRLRSLCHDKDAQLRKRHSEIISLKATLRDALGVRNRQEQMIRVQNLNTTERLKNLREEKDVQLKVLVNNVQSLEAKLKEATTLDHQKEQMIRILNHNVEMAEERIRNLQNEKSNKQAEELLKIQCKKKDDEVKVLTRHIVLLKQDLIDTVALKDDARTKFEKSIAEEKTWIAQLQSQLVEQEKSLSEAKAKLSQENEELSKSNTALKKRNQTLLKDKLELNRQLKIARTENEEMHRNFRANGAVQRDLQNTRRDADNLYNRLRDKEEDMRRELRAMEDDLAGYRRDLKDAEKEKDKLYARLKNKDKELEDVHERLKTSEKENDELYARLKKKENDIEDMHERLKKSERVIDELYTRQDIEDIHERLKKSEKANDELYNRLKKKDEAIQDAQEEIKLMQRIQKGLKFDLEEMQREKELESRRRYRDMDNVRSQDENPKRRRPTYAVVIKNLYPSDQVLSEVESYFANRIGLHRTDLRASRMNLNRDSYIFLEFPTQQMQRAGLRLDGSRIGGKTIEVHEWVGSGPPQNHRSNEPSATDKQQPRISQQLEGIKQSGGGESSIAAKVEPSEQQDSIVAQLEAKLVKVIQDQNALLQENQSLRKEKKDMQQTISTLETSLEENEQLREEIEQMRMNHAMEMGFMEG